MRPSVVSILLLAAACSSKKGQDGSQHRPGPTAPKTVAQPAAETPATTTVPALKTAAAPGKAYLVVDPTGIVEIDHGKPAHAITLPDDDDQYARSIVRAANGDLLVETVGKIYRISHGKVSLLAEAPIGLDGTMVPAPDGSLWVWSITTAGHFDGKTWTEIKSDSLGHSGIVGMTVGNDGKVWLAEQQQLFAWDGSAFKPVALAAIGDALLESLAAASDGKVYLATSRGILDITAASPKSIEVGDLSVDPRLVAGPEGRVAMIDFSGNFSVLVPPGSLVHYPNLSTNPEAIAFDGAGRIWISTKSGLVVYDATGKPTSLPTGTVPMLGGKITGIVVDGGGPELPAAGEVERGRVKGTVSNAGGTALAGAKVEICAEAKMMYDQGKSPCADEPFTKQATTDADGDFSFDDVPVGTWSFAVLPKPGDKWVITFRNFCSSMKKGETCNEPLQLGD